MKDLEQTSAEGDTRAAHSALPTTPSLPESSAPSHWDFINDWKVQPQSNDRPPEFGVIGVGAASPSARRSTTRRKHQQMFKAWSQSRNE